MLLTMFTPRQLLLPELVVWRLWMLKGIWLQKNNRRKIQYTRRKNIMKKSHLLQMGFFYFLSGLFCKSELSAKRLISIFGSPDNSISLFPEASITALLLTIIFAL